MYYCGGLYCHNNLKKFFGYWLSLCLWKKGLIKQKRVCVVFLLTAVIVKPVAQGQTVY